MTEHHETEQESLMQFPCDFSIKVMGHATDDFYALVLEIMRHHTQAFAEKDITTRPSKGGKYIAVTVTFVAQSRQQLDALYEELTSHERVLMVL